MQLDFCLLLLFIQTLSKKLLHQFERENLQFQQIYA